MYNYLGLFNLHLDRSASQQHFMYCSSGHRQLFCPPGGSMSLSLHLRVKRQYTLICLSDITVVSAIMTCTVELPCVLQNHTVIIIGLISKTRLEQTTQNPYNSVTRALTI